MVPIGGIINWSGAIVDIPDNWQLCDGTGGTPDLRDRFVIGAGGVEAVDDTGGAVTHAHSVVSTLSVTPSAIAPIWDSFTDGNVTATADGRPPYYALAYIQRMS